MVIIALFFQCLIVLEEMLHLFERVRIHVGDVFYMVKTYVFGGYADNLVVGFTVVDHFHKTYGSYGNENTGWDRIGRKHDDIERIAVVPECFRGKSIVEWIGRSGKVDTVELDEAGLYVDFVFVV